MAHALVGRWLTLGWQAHYGACLRQRERPAGALARVRYLTRPGVHYDRIVGVRPGWLPVAGWNAMVPVNGLGMDLDDPDQRLGRHPRADVSLRLDRLTLRVRGENQVDPIEAGKESRARFPDNQPACPCGRHDAARQRTAMRGGRTQTSVWGGIPELMSPCDSTGSPFAYVVRTRCTRSGPVKNPGPALPMTSLHARAADMTPRGSEPPCAEARP